MNVPAPRGKTVRARKKRDSKRRAAGEAAGDPISELIKAPVREEEDGDGEQQVVYRTEVSSARPSTDYTATCPALRRLLRSTRGLVDPLAELVPRFYGMEG
jgi:hypothetical protein